MRQHQLPSGVGITAITVAMERRIETERPDRLFRDPLAAAFCDAARDSGASALEGFPGFGISLSDYAPTMRGYMALRTRFLDDVLLDACRSGCHQIVIVAAGLDARAYRLPYLDGTRVYELDASDVLTFKRRVADEAGAVPTCTRREVPVDLREDWLPALRAAGFSPEEPTAWLVEGLLLYLTTEENERLFERIGRVSAPGSRLGTEHVHPSHLRALQSRPEIIETAERLGISWKSAVEDPVGWFAHHGWQVEIADGIALAKSFGRTAPAILDPAQGTGHAWLLRGSR